WSGENWEWMAAHASNPRVMAAVREKLDWAANDHNYLGKPKDPTFEDQINRVVLNALPTDDAFVAAAARLWSRKDYAPAATWVKGFESDPRVTAALRGEIIDVATNPLAWREFHWKNMDPVEEMLSRLLPELDRRGVSIADVEVRNAAVSCVLRYDLAAVRPWVEKVEGTPGMTAALVAHVERIGKSRGYSEGPGEIERVVRMLVRLRPAPTDDMLVSLGRFGDNPETDKPFAAWGPKAAERLVAVRDALPSDKDWERTQTTFLIGRLGMTKASAEDIRRIVDELRSRDRDFYSPPDPGVDAPLRWIRISPSEYQRLLGDSIPGTIESLVKIGRTAGPAMVDVWKNSRDRLALYVTTRALAKGAPVVLAAELDRMLDEFAPIAQILAEKGSAAKNFTEEQRYQWRSLGPNILEAMAAFGETEQLPDEIAACLWHALSCPLVDVSGPAGRLLEKQVPPDLFARGLFVHLNQKSTYRSSEIDAWVNRVTKRPESGPHIASSMAALLKVAGSPEAVPMIHKLVGLRALAIVGDAEARPTLERYAADPSEYLLSDVNSRGGREFTTNQRRAKFADLAKAALEAIK
ncbi:MAG TPA: hypothetical protein VE981_24840, partial [Planctomycetota bacterium]|nr:hypothetical protein [Planctomycetota bacterium]